MFDLPYEPMTPERKQFVHSLMVAAARAIDDCHGQYSRVQFRAELMKQLNDTNPVVFGVPVLPQAIEAVRACKAVEWEVVRAYSRLVKLVLKKWIKGGFTCYTDAEDIYQEGLCALIDAIYSFKGIHKGQPIKFKTFAYKAIDRRMGRAVNSTMIEHLRRPCHVQTLMAKYDAMKSSLGAVSPTEVMDAMGITIQQRSKLERAFLRVVTEEVLTGERVSASSLIPAKESVRLEPDERQSLVNIMGQLSEFERAVLDGCGSGGYGWQAEVASQFVNPKTQRPYSRRAPHVALGKIRHLLRAS